MLLVSLGSSFIHLGQQGWWLPIFGAGIALIGLYSEESKIVDIGTLLLAASFFFLVRTMQLNYLSLIFILSMFFIYLGLWLFMRRSLFIKYMKDSLPEETSDIHFEEYKKDSALYYLRTLVLGYSISLLGGVIAFNSFIGPFPADLTIFLMILLSISLIFGIYFVLFLLPRVMAS